MNRVEYDIVWQKNQQFAEKKPRVRIYTQQKWGLRLSALVHNERRNLFLKKSITEDTNQKGSNNTNTGEVGKGAEPLSRGCLAPGTGSAAGELSQGTSTFIQAPNPCQNPTLISLIRVTSASAILFRKALYRKLQSFCDRESKQRAPTFHLAAELTCSHPTTWDRNQAPTNKPLPPTQKLRTAASLKKLFQNLRFRKFTSGCYP